MTSRTTDRGNQDIALSVRAHDRVGRRRTDENWLNETWAASTTRVLQMVGSRFPSTSGAVDWSTSDGLSAGQRVFLGEQAGRAHFALLLEDSSAFEHWTTFREVGPKLSPGDAGLVVHALALAEWHRAHRHCPHCGGLLEVNHAGHVRTCPDCGKQQFPRTDPAVIMVVTDGERCLLGRQPRWPEGRFSTLAGFVDPGESLEEAVRREVAEEVGVEVGRVTYFGNQPWPFPASLMVGFFAEAVSTEISVDGEEISDARWFTREEMKAETEAGTLHLPGGISISRSLVEEWYGGPLPGQW
ncbi:MAG: NAD(+) diphosphatase [Actinomycetota bacterium]|nr:NAD(+) diphosphatase [Actinomycetota bacterium]